MEENKEVVENQEVETSKVDPEYLRNPKRNEGEDYEAFKSRRSIVNKLDKVKSKGIWFWRSKNLKDPNNSWGTYSKRRANEILNKFIELKKKEKEEKDVTTDPGK